MSEEIVTMQFEDQIICPACEWVPTSQTIWWREFQGVRVPYAECPECGVFYQVRRFTDTFTYDYYHHHYRKMMYGDVIPDRERDYQLRRALAQAEMIADNITSNPTSMLDIGCGLGHLLQEVTTRMTILDAMGAEIDPNYAEEACQLTGLTVLKDYGAYKNDTFGLITMSHVLEHFNHPLTDLKNLRDMLSPGGWLMIEVPNALADRNAFLLHHPIAFTMESLHGMMSRLGFVLEYSRLYDPYLPTETNIFTLWRKRQ